MLVIVTGVVYNQMERIHAVGVVIPILNAILICAVVYWGYKNIGSDHDSADESSRTKGVCRKKIAGGEIDDGKQEERSLKNLSTWAADASSTTRQVEE